MKQTRLLFFYGTECSHCEKMMPLIEKLEKELDKKFERYEVWHNEENAKLMDIYDKGFCGGVPFFWNTESKKWLCGEIDYQILKDWALGKSGNIEGL